jgi:hypothetical protein
LRQLSTTVPAQAVTDGVVETAKLRARLGALERSQAQLEAASRLQVGGGLPLRHRWRARVIGF